MRLIEKLFIQGLVLAVMLIVIQVWLGNARVSFMSYMPPMGLAFYLAIEFFFQPLIVGAVNVAVINGLYNTKGWQVGFWLNGIFMLLAFYVLIGFLLTVPFLASKGESLPLIANVLVGFWSSILIMISMPPLSPIYRMMRVLPISFWSFIRAVVGLPLLYSSPMLALSCLIIGFTHPQDAYFVFAVVFGIFFGIAPLYVFVSASMPEARQTIQFVFVAVAATCGVVCYYLSWLVAIPLVLAANVYFIRKAAHEWNCREEGLSV